MDCRRTFPALLIPLLIASANSVPLREARWSVAEPNRLSENLLYLPADCAKPVPKDRMAFQIGEVAFRNPLTLGGQAARAGLSCHSCHKNGRDNPHFLFPGLSGAPGTADITSSLMSQKRGDGISNPVPIPDLANPKHKVSRNDVGKLEAFIEGLIVEEFDGPAPSPAVLSGLATYVRGFQPEHCVPNRVMRQSVRADIAVYTKAIEAAAFAMKKGDQQTALAMLSGARAMLGTINERYAPAALEASRASLAAQDATIAAAMAQLRDGKPFPSKSIRRQQRKLFTTLLRDEHGSYYDADVLARTLGLDPTASIGKLRK